MPLVTAPAVKIGDRMERFVHPKLTEAALKQKMGAYRVSPETAGLKPPVTAKLLNPEIGRQRLDKLPVKRSSLLKETTPYKVIGLDQYVGGKRLDLGPRQPQSRDQVKSAETPLKPVGIEKNKVAGEAPNPLVKPDQNTATSVKTDLKPAGRLIRESHVAVQPKVEVPNQAKSAPVPEQSQQASAIKPETKTRLRQPNINPAMVEQAPKDAPSAPGGETQTRPSPTSQREAPKPPTTLEKSLDKKQEVKVKQAARAYRELVQARVDKKVAEAAVLQVAKPEEMKLSRDQYLSQIREMADDPKALKVEKTDENRTQALPDLKRIDQLVEQRTQVRQLTVVTGEQAVAELNQSVETFRQLVRAGFKEEQAKELVVQSLAAKRVTLRLSPVDVRARQLPTALVELVEVEEEEQEATISELFLIQDEPIMANRIEAGLEVVDMLYDELGENAKIDMSEVADKLPKESDLYRSRVLGRIGRERWVFDLNIPDGSFSGMVEGVYWSGIAGSRAEAKQKVYRQNQENPPGILSFRPQGQVLSSTQVSNIFSGKQDQVARGNFSGVSTGTITIPAVTILN